MLSERRVRWLLGELCVRLGFCLPAEEVERLVANPPEGVESFAEAVIRAEGLEPESMDRGVYRAVRECVAAGFRRGEC